MSRGSAYLLPLIVIFALCRCAQAAYPAGEIDTEADLPAPKYVKLLFAGDVMCHYPQITAAQRGDSFDFSPSFEFVKPIFESADAVIVNLETVISPDNRYSGYPTFSSPAALAEALKQAGVDIATTANNHCCDRGARGIRSTAACLDSLGIARTGTFTDSLDYLKNGILRFERNGIRFALLSYTYGTNGIPVPAGCIVNAIDTVKIARDLLNTADSDCRIVFLHWGEEYQRFTNAEQLRIKDFLQRHGVEIVIGSHPHVIQPAEAVDNRIFVSSLGNFVSNQRKRYCNGGLMAEVAIEQRSDGTYEYSMKLIPVWVKLPGYRILPPEAADTIKMSATEHAQYKQFIADTEELLSKREIL